MTYEEAKALLPRNDELALTHALSHIVKTATCVFCIDEVEAFPGFDEHEMELIAKYIVNLDNE